MKSPRTLLLALPLAGSVAASPVASESTPEEGLSLMERGARIFIEGLMKEFEPAMEDLEGAMREMQPKLREFVDQMGPALSELLNDIGDLSAYSPPEMLPNGDIIMRRKTPPPEPKPEGEAIDL
jgi:hypothetical protein